MILVTGATGFLGSHICRMLMKENKPFIALKRHSSSLTMLPEKNSNINWHVGDVLEITTLEEIMPKIDTIIHCAATVSFHQADKNKMERTNVEGTRNMVNLALKYDIKYFIHISSVAALSRSENSVSIDENNKWKESKWNTNYGESKYLAELEVWRGMIEGLNAVILNPSVILGPGEWTKGSPALFKYVWDERKFYTGGKLNYVDVRDVSKIVSICLQNKPVHERFIINAGAIPFKDFFSKVAETMKKKSPSIKANRIILVLAVLKEKLQSVFSKHNPIITSETTRGSQSQVYFENSKVKSKLSFSFVPLEETIRWTCKEILQNKK